MPEMPKEMIDGFAMDHSATDAKAEELLQDLKKHVLRSKLIVQRQQANYEQSQAENPTDVNSASPEAKLYALNVVKNTLINWIETQLAKAGDDGADTDVEDAAEPEVQYDHEAMITGIQQKYQRHIELRQQILDQLAQMDQIKEKIKLVTDDTTLPKTREKPISEELAQPPVAIDAYLLLPYIEQLQVLARQQKAMVQEKSHINASLAKQRADTKQTLDRLARESQLLSRYPVAKEPSKSQSTFEEAIEFEELSIKDQVKPWIYAADSAKLATLEDVAESVEVGMESIDEARAHLEQVCRLLIPFPKEGEETAYGKPEDTEQSSPSTRKGQAKKEGESTVKTIWDILDGNLGSINE